MGKSSYSVVMGNVLANPPFDLTKPHQGDAQIEADWSRTDINSVTIGGNMLGDLICTYKNETGGINRAQLKQFFIDKILQNVDEQLRDAAADYLLTTFHQSGLLNPIDSALDDQFTDKSGTVFAGANATHKTNLIHIRPTQHGFSISAQTTFKALNPIGTSVATVRHSEQELIVSDEHQGEQSEIQGNVLDVGATIEIEFRVPSQEEKTSTERTLENARANKSRFQQSLETHNEEVSQLSTELDELYEQIEKDRTEKTRTKEIITSLRKLESEIQLINAELRQLEIVLKRGYLSQVIPEIKVVAINVDYGNAEVMKLMDKRNLLQRIRDFFLNFFVSARQQQYLIMPKQEEQKQEEQVKNKEPEQSPGHESTNLSLAQ